MKTKSILQKPIAQYDNTGYEVLSPGIQNWKGVNL